MCLRNGEEVAGKWSTFGIVEICVVGSWAANDEDEYGETWLGLITIRKGNIVNFSCLYKTLSSSSSSSSSS